MNKKLLIGITAGLVVTVGSAAAIAAFQKANSTWQFVPGSVVKGDTFKATKGDVEKTIKICGVNAPELNEPFGTESREYLRSLLEKGNGKLIVKPVEENSHTLVAQVEVPTNEGYEDLTGQLVNEGIAKIDRKTLSTSCFPSLAVLGSLQALATTLKKGLWQEKYIKLDGEELKRLEQDYQKNSEKYQNYQNRMAVLSLDKYERLEKERELFKRKCMATPGCMEKKVKED
jgi:endonuclease YncB( thermonuclease family)